MDTWCHEVVVEINTECSLLFVIACNLFFLSTIVLNVASFQDAFILKLRKLIHATL